LRAGLTRAEFARKINVGYGTIDTWDRGVAMPALKNLANAAPIVGYSVEELLHGRGGAAPGVTPIRRRSPEHGLSMEEVQRLMEEVHATGDQAIALGKHRGSDEGRFQPLTRSYCLAYIGAFAAAKAEKKDDATAANDALRAAITARANVEAEAKAVMPIDPDALTAALAASDEDTGTMRRPTLAKRSAKRKTAKRRRR
jgi:transcriptional regulator with XRE-family HTH domain